MLKKLLFVVLLLSTVKISSAQCVPDINITNPGIFPDSATGLVSGVINQVYNQVIQIKVPTDTFVNIQGNLAQVTIDSIVLTTFSGLPPGITYASNPGSSLFPGGSNGCVLLSGTPTAAGTYNITAITRTKGKLTGLGIPLPVQIDTIDYYKITINTQSGLGSHSSLKFEMFQNEPNPFNSLTNIAFSAPVQMMVTLKVFNLLGKEVFRKNYNCEAGRNSIKFDGEELNPGVYMYSLSNGVSTFTRRMIINRK